jgi:hypothetical protein
VTRRHATPVECCALRLAAGLNPMHESVARVDGRSTPAPTHGVIVTLPVDGESMRLQERFGSRLSAPRSQGMLLRL